MIPKPVRKIGPNYRSVTGHYVFAGIGSIQFESTIERDFLTRTEFFGDVTHVVLSTSSLAEGERHSADHDT